MCRGNALTSFRCARLSPESGVLVGAISPPFFTLAGMTLASAVSDTLLILLTLFIPPGISLRTHPGWFPTKVALLRHTQWQPQSLPALSTVSAAARLGLTACHTKGLPCTPVSLWRRQCNSQFYKIN